MANDPLTATATAVPSGRPVLLGTRVAVSA